MSNTTELMLIGLCGWCAKFWHLPDGDWQPTPVTVPEPFECTHGICPDCETAFWGDMGQQEPSAA